MCNMRYSRFYCWGIEIRIDDCMKEKIKDLNMHTLTLACCCGHGRYPESIIIRTKKGIFEYHSGLQIKRTRRFYKIDSDGYYYIPELEDKKKDVMETVHKKPN